MFNVVNFREHHSIRVKFKKKNLSLTSTNVLLSITTILLWYYATHSFQSSFQEFERTLATKATEIKGKSLTEQAKSIALRSLEYCDRLKKAIGKKKTEKLQRLGEELASAKKGSKTLHNPFESINSEDEDLQVSTSDTNLLEEVNKKLSEGALEEHSVEFFLKKINEKTTKAIASKRDEISKAYQDWKKNTACRKFQSFNLRFREPPQLQYRELPKEEYNCLFDPHYYYTSNFLLPCTFGVVALASPAVALLVAVKAGAWVNVKHFRWSVKSYSDISNPRYS